MYRGSVDAFILVINYLSDSWIFMDATIELFKVHDITRETWLGSWNLCLENMI
jgi:hypothetical protein